MFEDYNAPEEEGFSWKTSPAGRVSVTTALVTIVEPVLLTTIVYSTTLLISVLGTLAVLVMVTAEGTCSCNDNSTQRHTNQFIVQCLSTVLHNVKHKHDQGIRLTWVTWLIKHSHAHQSSTCMHPQTMQ